uniref:Uncharacterized protein n=1 Tax=Hammarskog picorna-like virus TaxID=2665417 RepID=A0A5Q0V1C4_9VIRU|nr:hypothetical protein [Hammarskog picorna-like virus]
MYNNISAADINTTLQIKSNEFVPSIEPDEESLFQRCIDSGYTVTVNTPVARDSKNALFGVNLSGFIPDYSPEDPYWTLSIKNMSAVQVFPSSRAFVKVEQDMQITPQMHAMLSNRYCSGTVNVILRVSSNTGQTGNLIITQQSGLVPRLYPITENYQGARFENDGHYTSDPMICNFVISDTSMIRQIGIRTVFRQPVELVDIQKKIFEFTSSAPSVAASSQFPEDWLMVGLVSNLPDASASQLFFRIFFDYSEVNFICPMYPMMPAIPHSPAQQILQISRTLVDSAGPKKDTAYFLPLNALTYEDSVRDALAKLELKQQSDLITREARDRLMRINAERTRIKNDLIKAAAIAKAKDSEENQTTKEGNVIPNVKSSA